MLDGAAPQGLFAIREGFTNEPKCGDMVPQVASSVASKVIEKNVPLSFFVFFSAFYILFMPLTN